MRRRLWKVAIVLLWIAAQACLFAYKYRAIMTSMKLGSIRRVLGHTLAISRASAIVINFNSSLILFCCCRMSLTYIRGFRIVSTLGLPIDDSISLHKLTGFSIGVFSLVHIIGHYFNFTKYAKHYDQNVWALLFLNNTGLSGHLILLVKLILTLTAGLQIIRSKKYEIFFYAHKLFILYFVFLSIHGAFCFIRTDDPAHPCIPPQSWIWIAPGLVVYLAELLIRTVRSRRFTYVSKVILHQSSVFELQIRKPSFSFMPGQYILLNVPSASHFQWHPFTITSAPEDDFISVHIRAVGDWTHGVAEAFGIKPDLRTKKFGMVIETPSVMPKVFIDGPFGAPCQDFSRHEVVICIGAGIGQTPFSSVLRSIWYKVVHPSEEVSLKKIIFIGVCRNVSALEWFHDVLRALEGQDTRHFLEIRYFLTGQLKPEQVHDIMYARTQGDRDPITGLKAPTYFGRPNFDPIIRELREQFYLCKIGVFYCGPAKLAKRLSKLCASYSDEFTPISFYKEHFEQ